MNPLLELLKHGQSYWLDNLAREKLRSGELEHRVREQGLRGVTSNPAIFHKAISQGQEYDDEIERLVRDGCSVSQVYERLVVSDIQTACDVLSSVYDESDGEDGFVSLEVSPYLAHDPTATLGEARHLFATVDRPNVFIKIPGTQSCVPAIEEALFEGININITLLFSIESYEAIAEAYLKALERRIDAGLSVDQVASVASFFLSRIDVLVDGLLGNRLAVKPTGQLNASAMDLMGVAAVANAKLAYESFRTLIASDRWKHLEAAGAKVQRMLWASTSTKNPLYDDVRYVEPLIGPHTVNTLPDQTIEAFADHGVVADTVEDGLEAARSALGRLAGVGIDFDYVTRRLLDEGVQKFIDPFDKLMGMLARKRSAVLGGCLASDTIAAGDLKSAHAGALAALRQKQAGRRLFAKDPTLWTSDAGKADVIRSRLGWLESPNLFRGQVEEIVAFAREVRDEGTRHVVLLGMGGSSLSADIVREAFGIQEGWPALLVLDDTDPAAVLAVREVVNVSHTHFLVASKSGGTAETLSFYRYFYQLVKDVVGDRVGSHFSAITDGGSPLSEEAEKHGFRRLFKNPSDIGGRYSALSYFGLVPMALTGVDVGKLLDYALAMRGSCEPVVPAAENPGLRLGALLGVAGLSGRDKVTFLAGGRTDAFGVWAEQLLAESTGKRGRGLIPITGDSLFPPVASHAVSDAGGASAGTDRVFVHLRVLGETADDVDAFLSRAEDDGHPTIRIELDDISELGAEFLRWEIATAVAGSMLRINPFDEPNVSEAKANTRALLEEWSEHGQLPEPEPVAEDGDLSLTVANSSPPGDNRPESENAQKILESFLDSSRERDYVGLLPYFHTTPEREQELAALRREIAARLDLPVTLGHGPRYLHSSGQLHKGGPNTGLFLMITTESSGDVEIPGDSYGFSTLQRAQALGDFRALVERGRRVVRVHVLGDVTAGLARLRAMVRGDTRPATDLLSKNPSSDGRQHKRVHAGPSR